MTESPEAGTTPQTPASGSGTTDSGSTSTTGNGGSTQAPTSGPGNGGSTTTNGGSGSTSGSGSTATGSTGGNGSSNGGNGNGNGEGEDEGTSEETAAQGAKLLAADVARQQARVNALATGLQEHQDELDDAEAAYEEVRGEVNDDALRFAYVTMLDPVGLADQTRQVDTSGLGGFGSSAGVVHASNVFGSRVQRAVAEMATQSDPAPVTVVGVPASDLADPGSVEKAKGKKERRQDRKDKESASQ